MLSSHRCKCSLAVVLCLLVSLLGVVVFVVFSNIYMVLGGDFHCSTHAAILVPPHQLARVFKELLTNPYKKMVDLYSYNSGKG